MITQRYRQDYNGEFFVLSSGWRQGIKGQSREWIDNPIQNQHISGRAAAIGSDVDFERFDYSVLERHRGGLHGKLKLQTYGAGDTWSRMRLDFYYTNHPTTVSKIRDNQYYENTVVYTTPYRCVTNPKKFYPVPYNPRISDIALPLYLSAFDGHKEVFMIGYNNDTRAGKKNWTADVESVIRAYWNTTFTIIGSPSNIPELWKRHKNVKTISYRDFIYYCDI
jgi:hypothetical protein